MVCEFSTATLVALASDQGFTVTPEQVARWHRDGLLPTPRQHSLGRGRGTESLYPSGTDNQLIALLRIHRKKRRLATVAWMLWWEKFPVSEALVRETLLTTSRKLARVTHRMVNPVNGGLSEEALQGLDAGKFRLPMPVAAMARKLPPGHVEALEEMVVEMLAGTYRSMPLDPSTADAFAMVSSFERLWGLERARTDALDGHGPWLTGTYEEVAGYVQQVAGLLRGVQWADLAQTAPWADVLRARDQLQKFTALMSMFSNAADQALGKGAFGFSMVGKLLSKGLREPFPQSFMVLLWMIMRGIPEIQAGQDVFETLAQELIPTWTRSTSALETLAKAFPQAHDLLDPAALLRSLRTDPDRIDFQGRLAAFRAEHAEALDQFFDQHPEFRNPPTADDGTP